MLRQTYALKILTADSPSNTNWRRFQTEARTIAKLDHPNIIKVPYYVMELLPGDSLSALVRKRGHLTPAEVIELFLPLCEGLAYAHSHGIVHKDIKPSNIMLVEQKGKLVPKLVDFGLVKLVGNALSPSQQLTATGIGKVTALTCAGLAIFLLGGGSAAFLYLKYGIKYGKDRPAPARVDSLSMGGIQKEAAVNQTAALDKELDNIDKPGDHPKIFRKFNPDDLQAIVLPSATSDTDDILLFLSHMNQLSILNAGGTDVNAAGLKTIGEMPALTCLYLPKTKRLTGPDLSHLSNLKRLSQINFSGGKDLTSLLKALKGSETIELLTLDQTRLTQVDLQLMATMPNLAVISLTGCHLTDKELVPLTKLQKSQKLFLRGNDLSPQFIDLFKNSPRLIWIELCKPNWGESELKRFDTAFKLRYSYRDLPSLEV